MTYAAEQPRRAKVIIFHTYCVDTFMVCLHTKSQMPSFSDAIVIAITLVGKEEFCVAAMFLFYIIEKNHWNKKVTNISELYY
jgi:hypothetical protein